MALLKQETQDNFTMVSNLILRNPHISLKAVGMYSKLVSLPNDWKFTEEGLSHICKDKVDSVKTALKELEELNLLYRFRIRNKNGTLGETIYYVSNFPMNEDKKQEIEGRFNPQVILVSTEKSTFSPEVDFPALEKPMLEKQSQYNTNIYNTNKYNIICVEIIKYLNEKTGKSFRATSNDTKKHINARLNEKYTLEDFKTVIDNQCSKWMGTEYEQYLRPSTLFGTKFENYLNSSNKKKQDTSEKIDTLVANEFKVIEYNEEEILRQEREKYIGGN